MKCANPILCYRTSTGATYRHFNLANRLFKNLANQVFNCGTCIFCRKKRATELAIRCVLHASLYETNCFLTLTYDEKQKEYHNNFQYKDIQDFKKRFRDYCKYHFNKSIQLFNVHEYGKNGKKHWHLVCFNHDFSDKTLYTVKKGNNLYTSAKLRKLWPFGIHTIGNVTEASAMYQAQYTQKDFKNGNLNNAKKSHSKHSGIGRDYFLRHYRQLLSLGYIPFGGRRIPLPRYFQRIAHKHYSHFYAPENFFDYPHRKRLYTPFNFRTNWPNKEIADLYQKFSEEKQTKIDQLEIEWEETLDLHLQTNNKPDFIIAAENYIYDQKNRLNKNEF